MRHGRFLALALLAGWLLATAAAAQTTASLRGVVQDANGAPVADATVDAVNTESGVARSAKSDAQGRFSLPGLVPGTYAVAVTSPGGATVSQEIQLLLGQDLQVEFSLAENQLLTENVTVFGEAVQLLVETKDSQLSTNVTPQQIEALPLNNRNFLAFANLAPGVRFTDDQDATSKFRSGGQDSRQVNVFIDGLSYKNDVLQGGAFMQDNSRGNPFPQAAVQEFRVLTQNYKAEYEKAAAAVITAVTKSGGNEISGDAFFLYQDKDLVSQDDFSRARGEKKGEYERKQYGLSLGGPIQQDKLHYFLTYERNEQDRNASVFRGGAFDSAPASVRQFLGGFPIGVLTQPFESDLYFGKLSWQPAAGQSVQATVFIRDEQDVRGFGTQRTLDGAESQEISTDAFTAKHTAVFGKAFNEVSLMAQTMEWNPAALDSSSPRLNYIGILDVGGKDATQDFVQDKIGVRDDVTWLFDWRGQHTLKAGGSFNRLDYEVTKTLFPNGLFEFRSDEQWLFPFQARVGFGDPTLDFSNNQLGLYAQDDWQLLDNLTVSVGLRWDYESNMLNNDYRTPPELQAALESACQTFGQPLNGRSTWCLRDFLDLDRYTTDGDDRDAYTGMWQPRFGFSWDVRGTGKTVVFGGWGKYYDRVNLNDIFDEQYRQQYKIFSFCFSETGAPAPNCGAPTLQWNPSFLSAAALRGLVASGQAPGPEVFLVANDMKPPRSEQFTVGLRQQLGRWLGSLAYAGVRGHNGLSYFFGDRVPGATFDQRFGNNVPVPGYGRVFVTSTERRSWYDALLLSIDRPLTADGKWGLNVAYTYAEAEQEGTDNTFEGIVFGAFDYLDSSSFYGFPASNTEDHRLVISGVYQLPANFQVSSLITLGSGVPYTIFDDSVAPFTVRWNEGQPEKEDFIIPDAWAYRSVDLRLQWDAPPIMDDVVVSLIAEGFNIFDYDNGGCFESFKPRLPSVNARFGEPNCEFNTRRLQGGVRVAF